MNNLFTISATFLALAAFMNSASAQVIPVGNFSFESPTTSGYTVEKSIPDWAFTVAGTNPTGVETLVSAYGNTGSSQGVNYAFLNIPSGTADLTYTGTGANALPDIVAGENYTLTVALGNRTEDYPSQPDGTAGNDTLNLQVDGTTYATVSVNETELPLNTFTDESITLTAATISADGLVGQPLGIQLTAAHYGSDAFDQGAFDNVRLTESAVPEPGTWAMMLAGVLFMVGLNYRRLRA